MGSALKGKTMKRRHWCAWSALALISSSRAQSPAARLALAQERFTLVAPFPPGGPVDTLSRVLAEGLTKRYGPPALVDNLPGGAGNIGMDKVRRAKPDGHTLLVIPAGNLTINPTLMPNFPFQIEQDFVPVTMLAKTPNVLVAHPSTGFKHLNDVIAQAKRQPGTLSFASPGVGSGLHLAGELFKQQAGIDLLHVPYKGTGPALNDVLGGTVPLMFSNLPAVLGHIRSGKLLALGLTDSVRSPVAPEIPFLAEQGVSGVVVTSWYGLLAPGGTPASVVEQLASDAREILAQPEVVDKLQRQGLSLTPMLPTDFAALIKRETAGWASILKARKISAE
jgi:tripartite-type tricarboxylate transporter receptor subunit TctC